MERHNQMDHILIDRRRHSSTGGDMSFRVTDCDTDYYLVVAKGMERLLVSKRATPEFDMERFNLKKLNAVDGKELYQVKNSNRFATLENLYDDLDNNRVWNTVGENIKFSAKQSLGCNELKQHKPWFDEGCSKLLDQRKPAKLQWFQNIRTK
jgi:hypothetical protein